LTVKTPEGKFPLEEGIKETLKKWGPTKLQHPDGSVGKNVGYRIGEEIKPNEIIALEYMDEAKSAPVLVAERMVKGQKTGIIAIPSCMVHWGGKTQIQEIAALRRIVKAFQKHQKDWKNVIIDVRQNGGGDGFPIREIAETLYGNKVPYCLETQKRNTPESEMRLLFPGVEEDYIGPALPFNGQKKGLYVLMDREVASSAEAIVPMLKHYPDVKFIGENTCGCCQYGGLQPISLPNGGQINIGSVYRSYEDGMVECVGHKPDINCTGRDAFQESIDQIGDPGRLFLHRCRDGIGVGTR
jgi:C-terminal processing protease CtpA/Prc